MIGSVSSYDSESSLFMVKYKLKVTEAELTIMMNPALFEEVVESSKSRRPKEGLEQESKKRKFSDVAGLNLTESEGANSSTAVRGVLAVQGGGGIDMGREEPNS